ncbi:hypothetical protein ACIQNU_27035 [Streptomyces sp. NPDC091292]|uniref:hypothetical protein n=1 Tax=Streptomyces sp. NPDC091292 TaxID=3365991 RepID=UPI0038169270
MSTGMRTRGPRRRRLRLSARTVMVAAVATATALVTSAAGAAPAPAPEADHGSGWRISRAGELSPEAGLTAVTTAGEDAAWAVGQQGFAGSATGTVLKWNGRSWTEDSAPGLPEVKYWHAVSAVSARDVWAYGWDETEETMARYDGRQWRRVALPELPGGAQHGFSELAAVPGRTWFAGGRWISTHARGTWTTTDLGVGTVVTDVYARSARDAWAVGGFALVGQPSRPVALHWDGARWTDVPLPFPGIRLADVYAESARSVWVSGYTSPVGEDGLRPKVLHWDGATWRDVTGPIKDISPDALSGDGRGGVWFSGDPAGWEGPPVFWHFARDRWTRTEGATVSYELIERSPRSSR